MVLGDAGVYDGDVREWHWNLGEGQRLSVARFLFQILIHPGLSFYKSKCKVRVIIILLKTLDNPKKVRYDDSSFLSPEYSPRK